MKQTIGNKIKRFALAMFAALCVGNVWAADIFTGAVECTFDLETKKLFFKREFAAFNTGTYSVLFSYSYTNSLGEEVTDSVRIEKTIGSGQTVWDDYWAAITKEFTLSDFTLGDVVTATAKFQKKSGNSWIDDFEVWEGDSKTTEVYVFDTRGVLSSDCDWNVVSKKFKVSGKTSGGDDVVGVKVKYVVGTEELETLFEGASVVSATYTSTTGEYEVYIDYIDKDSAVSWSVFAVFADGTEKIFRDPATNKEVLSIKRREYGNIKYYWTNSKGDGYWDTVGNWDEEPNRSYEGYPGVKSGTFFTCAAYFTNSASVNLNGKTFSVWDYEGQNVSPRGLQFIKSDDVENMVVRFTNGTLQMNDGEGDNSNPLLGADGVTVEFADGGIYKYPYQLAFAPGTTIIFSGDSTQPWKYNPANKGEGATTFIVRNGNVVSSYSADGDASATHTAIIENGVWMINEVVSRGIANVTKFVDGENQAKIALGDNVNGKTKTLKLTGTFEFTFAENQMSKAAYILPHSLVDGSQNATFKVDATAYVSKAKVPMVEAASATDFIPKLQVFENGVDVTVRRRAKLEWEGNTLYYVQDPIRGFRVIVR